MARLGFLYGLAIVAATLWLSLSTAHASPPDPTLAAPQIDPPAPAIVDDTDSLRLTDESLWTALQGDTVILILRDGGEAHGTVVAQSTHAIQFARERDGLVVGVPKSDVVNVRVIPRTEPPPKKRPDRGLIGGGAFLLTFGGAATLSGATMLAVYPEYTFIHLPLLLPGLVMLGSGAAMVAVAKRKCAPDKRRDNRTARLRLSPTGGVGHRSGHVGLVLRF